MPIPIDLITHKRLVLVKQIYQHALVLFNASHSPVSQIMTVIEFDLAIDTALKALINVLNPNFNLNSNFHELIKEGEKLYPQATKSPFQYKGQIKRVHDIRNDAQHKAKYPNPNEISDCRTYTRDFLEQFISDVWGRSLTSICLTDLIQHKLVKECLVKAETFFTQSNYPEAVLWADGARSKAIDLVKKSILGSPRSSSNAAFVIEESGKQKANKEVYRSFETTRETLLYIALGLNYIEYLRYYSTSRKYIAGADIWDDGDHRFYKHTALDQIDASTAEYFITYCIDTVVQIENRVGNLQKPFK